MLVLVFVNIIQKRHLRPGYDAVGIVIVTVVTNCSTWQVCAVHGIVTVVQDVEPGMVWPGMMVVTTSGVGYEVTIDVPVIVIVDRM